MGGDFAGAGGSPALLDSTNGNSAFFSGLTYGVTYVYRVTAIDSSRNESDFSNEYVFTPQVPTGIESENLPSLARLTLLPSRPNPFNPTTVITYGIPEKSRVTLKIHNILGQEVRTLVSGVEPAGYQSHVWDGKDNSGNSVASGIYIYRVEAGASVESRKMLLTR